jgi:polyisoprenoid-binding protein YceI
VDQRAELAQPATGVAEVVCHTCLPITVRVRIAVALICADWTGIGRAGSRTMLARNLLYPERSWAMQPFIRLGAGILAFAGLLAATSRCTADDYTIDPAHSGVTFKISHLGLSWVQGRFNELAGAFTLDPRDETGSKCAFNITIKADSIDTNNAKRDGHLRSPDFLNAKQFPGISFKSTAVERIKDGYQVTGNFTMHGVTKPITFALLGGLHKEFPKGVLRTGFSAELALKRSEFGMEKFVDTIGDNVYIGICFDGVKK